MTGCNLFGPSPEEQIYNHLEKAVSLEAGFKDQQTPLVTLEKKEQEIYDEITKLGMNDFDKIQSLSEKALESVNKRQELIANEKESIDAAQAEFEKIKPIIDEIEDEKLQSKANELYELMIKRYKTYDELYNNYKDAMLLDRELYKMFKNKDLTLEDLENKIKEINKGYEKVVEKNKEFNDLTTKYNELKKDFYKAAGLNVVYEQ